MSLTLDHSSTYASLPFGQMARSGQSGQSVRSNPSETKSPVIIEGKATRETPQTEVNRQQANNHESDRNLGDNSLDDPVNAVKQTAATTRIYEAKPVPTSAYQNYDILGARQLANTPKTPYSDSLSVNVQPAVGQTIDTYA